MKHDFIDKYSDRDSFIHRLDPRTKLVLSLLVIIGVVLTPAGNWWTYAGVFGILVFWLALSRLPLVYVLKRSLVIMPFVLMVTVLLPFFKAGEAAATIDIGTWQITLSRSGLEVLGNVLVKAWLSITTLVLLVATTGFSCLLKAMEQLKVPLVLTMLLSFMYRYIFVLTDELMRMRQARDSRSFGGSRLWQIKTAGQMIGSLFIRSYERGERVYAAMASRGFDGHGRTLSNLAIQRTDFVFGLAICCLLAISLWLGIAA